MGDRLSAHACPRDIELIDSLPGTPSGKIQHYLPRGKAAGETERQRGNSLPAPLEIQGSIRSRRICSSVVYHVNIVVSMYIHYHIEIGQ